MSYCLPVFRGVKQLLLCCCHYVSIIYSLKLYCFRLVPLIYDVMMWALNMQDWLYFFWAYWASWVWAGHEDTDTWHEDTNLCRTCGILTRSLVRIHSRLQRSIKLWSSFLQIRCTKPSLRYTRGNFDYLHSPWWIGRGLILINIFTFTPFLWKPCGGTKLKFQERSQ